MRTSNALSARVSSSSRGSAPIRATYATTPRTTQTVQTGAVRLRRHGGVDSQLRRGARTAEPLRRRAASAARGARALVWRGGLRRRTARDPAGRDWKRLLRDPRRRGEGRHRRRRACASPPRRLLRRDLDLDGRADGRRCDRDVPTALPGHPRQRAESVSAQAADRDVSNAADRSAAAASRERLDRLDERPFPPGDYDVVLVGSGPGGLQVAYSLARTGIPRCAVISRDLAPGGMFRRFPVYQRLISWTKPDAPFERGTREYEWYDHNSLVGDEREHQALAPEFMDRAFDVPARAEMEAALVEFATRGGVRVRYGCEWLSTRRDDAGFVLATSDGEYRCRVCVFAIGLTEPWVARIPGLEAAPHYVAAGTPERYQGKSVFIVGKRNSGFELAQGLLPWARRIVLASPRPVDTAMLAFSPLSIRYLSPYTEHIRGGSGRYVVDAAIEFVERHADGYRIHASGTTWEGKLEFESDEVIAATGFRAPVRDLPSLGVAMVNDGRMPAQTPYWESISAPGVYFAGNVMQASPGLRKHGATSSSSSVNGFRYNARVLARHIAENHFGLRRERSRLDGDE